jgi:pimeloyl-ACP methyl ester carboxylesterase
MRRLTAGRHGVLVLIAALALAFPSACGAQAAKAKDAGVDASKVDDLKKQATELRLETDDGVYLTAYLFMPPSPGKKTPVAIFVHDINRSQYDWFAFASAVTKYGIAVVTFDLRGHGESRRFDPRKYQAAGGRRAKEKGDQLSPSDFAAGPDYLPMSGDILTIKRRLLEEHNRGRLNIKQLGIVGAGPVASNLALELARDEYAPRDRGVIIGDLAAMVLINPSMNYKGMRPVVDMGRGTEDLPIMIISSDAPKSKDEASRLANRLRVPELPAPDPTGKAKARAPRSTDRLDSVWIHVKSASAGADLLTSDDVRISAEETLGNAVAGFLLARLELKRDRDWKERRIEENGFGTGRRPAED